MSDSSEVSAMGTTATLTIEEIYERELKQRSQQDRLRLLALLARDLAAGVAEEPPKRQRNILELEGLGADNPIGMDAQEYINELRKEWDHRP
jgi:hypothetical protein